jgi:outer membrane receptor protein involved in Fe transport
MIEALILAATATDPADQPAQDARQEIIVTGERISRSKHNTASSVVVETAESIDHRAAPDRVEQLLQSIPNVQLGSGGEGPMIRGQDSTGVVRDLPAFLSGTRPRATIRIDGRSATYYELAFGLTSLWDVARVEVFRSPQTTTQGRNSIGGAIFVETEEPVFDWQGRARVVIGESETRQISGVVTGPLIEGQLAFRLSGDLRRSQTSSRIVNRAVGIDPNRDDSELIRLKLQAEPARLPDLHLDLTYSHGRSQMPQFEGLEAPYEARRNPNATYGVFEIKVDSLTGRMAYNPGGEFEARATLSYGEAEVRRYPTPGLGDAAIDARDFSVEPVLAWRSASGIRLTGGLNYTRSTLDQTINLTALASVLGSGAFDDVQNSLGFFGEGSVPLLPGLTVTGGIRYQYDRQVRVGGLVGSALTLPLDYDRSYTAWLPKLSLDWDVIPTIRVGMLAQRASNPGGINLNTGRGRIELFDDEHLWDYELFARARLFGGKLLLSANAFRYDMTDAQRTQTIFIVQPNGPPVPSTQIGNAPRARTRGLEVELDWQPSKRIQLSGGIGLLDTKITESPDQNLLGKQFQRSPRFSGSAILQWTPVGSLTLSAQVRHNSSYFSDDLETATRRIAGSTTIDVKTSWSWRGCKLFGYARNLTDEFHLTYRYANGTATAGDPRELGVGFEAKF